MQVLSARILLFTLLLVSAAAQSGMVIDHVIVYKHERKLVLLSHGRQVKSYRVALGGNPTGAKTQQGDHRTPEGFYFLDSRNPNSHFHKAFHISYPSSKDIAVAKKLRVNPGGDIMLHGLPKESGRATLLLYSQDLPCSCLA